MIYIGMIFQYDNTQGIGLIMLSDGETKEFSSKDWVDSENSPKVGQKISYEESDNRIKIKVASEKDLIVSSDKEQKSDQKEDIATDTTTQHFTNVDDYINYYTDKGFKLIKDIRAEQLRTVTLRIFTETEHSEVIIKQDASKISVTQVVNGKTVVIK